MASLFRIHSSVKAKWKSGLKSETAFWEQVISGKVSDHAEDIQNRLNPVSELCPTLAYQLRDIPPGSTIKILDVGAGPLTALGKVLSGQNLLITAVDPLADKYRSIIVMPKSPLRFQPFRVKRKN